MAAWCRILVVLLFFLVSTEHSFADVDPNRLALLVDGILREYGVKGMFSLAVSIPENQTQNQNPNPNKNQKQNQNKNKNKNQKQNQNQNQNVNQIIQEVLNSDPADNVKNKINNGGVYVGSRVVAAKPEYLGHWTDHAESRVVNQLFNKPPVNYQDLLLFYVRASPCVEKCTNANHPGNILDMIRHIQIYNRYAVVFSEIFKPNNGEENTVAERTRALQQLANYKRSKELQSLGQNNIFRCDKQNNKMTCVGCFHNGEVKHYCVSDDPQSGTSQSKTSVSTNNHLQPSGSSSQTGVVGNRNTGRGWGENKRGGREVRDVSDNTGDGSSQGISESNKGAEDASSVDGKGSEVATGEGVSLSQTGSDDDKGSDLSRADDESSSQIGFDFGDGNGEVRGGKGKKGKWRGRKGKKGKWRGRKGKKGKWSRRGGRNRTRGRRRRPGLDQVWFFEK